VNEGKKISHVTQYCNEDAKKKKRTYIINESFSLHIHDNLKLCINITKHAWIKHQRIRIHHRLHAARMQHSLNTKTVLIQAQESENKA